MEYRLLRWFLQENASNHILMALQTEEKLLRVTKRILDQIYKIIQKLFKNIDNDGKK